MTTNHASQTDPSAEQSLQELVYAVSHDLGASVRAIKGFSDLLTRRSSESLDEDAKNFLRLMAQGATDLQNQLDGLLAFSRVLTRGQPFEPTAVADVWHSVVARCAVPIRELGAIVEQPDELPIILADPRQLEFVLAELLDNALKFRRDDSLRVRLSAQRSEPAHAGQDRTTNEWQLRMTDNGRGLEPQHLTRVFRMFQRLCPNVPGVGAGLAVCQRIVQRHGGTIWAESTPGVGTTICSIWPAARIVVR